MEHLKILFITIVYPTKKQPVDGVFVQAHAKAVQLYDDVVVLHCAGADPNLRQLWRMQQERDESLTEGIPTYRVWYRSFPIPKITYFIYIWAVFQAFRRIVSQGFRPHIIHAHFYEAGVPAVLIRKVYRIPVIVTAHFTKFPRKLLRRLDVWKARLAFNKANIVLPVSKSLQKAIEKYNIKARFLVLPNVVDTYLFHPNFFSQFKNRIKRLLFVGLLDVSHKKGMPYFLNALAQLRQYRDDWHLDVVGDGPARAEYEGMVADLGLTDMVTFHGLKSKQEVAEFMRQADLFVLPSLFETFAVVAAEALATGTPVLATRCGGPEEFITDVVGMLVPPGDDKALCKELNHMLSTLHLYSCHKISQYTRELFSPEIVGAKLHNVYQSLKL